MSKLNSYMSNRVEQALSDGLHESILDDIMEDAELASEIGVESDDDYNVYFFVKNIAPDIAKDTFGIHDLDCKGFCKHVLKNNKKPSLTDLRLLLHNFLHQNIHKQAYPNIGSGNINRRPQYDLSKWIQTVKEVNDFKLKDISASQAIEKLTEDWDEAEKYNFLSWYRYYDHNTPEKYDVKTANLQKIFKKEALIPDAWVDNPNRSNVTPNFESKIEVEDPKLKIKKEKEEKLENAKKIKKKLKSRIRSVMRLLEKYQESLPHQKLDSVYDEMYSLDKSISQLNVYSTMLDSIYRSSARLTKMGFQNEAAVLKKIADEGQTPTPTTEPKARPNVTVDKVISSLESVSQNLKTRDLIRNLASIDILLNEMGIASHFPEVSDAQAKLIEAFTYASNKVESTISKLRGGGVAKLQQTKPSAAVEEGTTPEPQQPVPAPPEARPQAEKVDTSEALSKPLPEEVKTQLPQGG